MRLSAIVPVLLFPAFGVVVGAEYDKDVYKRQDLDHAAINNDKDTDIQRPHGNANKEGLEMCIRDRLPV